MTTNGHAHATPHNGSQTTADGPAAEYMIIVHPAGRLDDDRAARYWTEVPALSACTADGASVEQAVENTRQEIARWLQYLASQHHPVPTTPDFRLDVQFAF
jgi:predicted RNase H-like HicB family nuclease